MSPSAPAGGPYAPTVPEIPASRTSERITWRTAVLDPNSFLPVLGLAILTMIAFPFTDSFQWGAVIAFPTSAGLLLLSIHRSKVKPRTERLAWIVLALVGVGTVVASALNTLSDGEDHRIIAISSLSYALLFTVAFPSVVRRALQHRQVTLNTLAAAIAAYLMLGIWFAMIFRFIAAVDGWTFFGPDEGEPTVGSFMYFSFITLTTVGYGDLTPATGAGRSAAVVEAVLGQVYLVTTVARVVSLLGSERTELRTLPLAPDEPPAHDFGSGPD